MIAASPSAIELEVEVATTAYAAEWIPLMVRVKRPDCWPTGVSFRRISSRDKSIQINDDFLNRDMELRAGETCRFTIPIQVQTRRVLALDSIFLEVAFKEDQITENQLIPLPKKLLNIQPSLGNE